MAEKNESDSDGNVAGWIIGALVVLAFLFFISVVPS